jgi:hypothetical protein
MATKRPTGSSSKGNKKSNSRPKVDFGKIVKDAAVNTAMVIGPGKFLKGAKALSAVQKAAVKRSVRENVAEKTAQRVGPKANPMRRNVPDKDAKLIANKEVGRFGPRPVKRDTRGNREALTSQRGLSKSESMRSKRPDTITRPKPNKPKTIVQIKTEKRIERNERIREALTPRVNPSRAKKTTRPVATPAKKKKPLRSISEVLKPLEGKKIKTGSLPNGRPIRMDAPKYVQERANQRIAARNPENSTAPAPRSTERSNKIAREKRLERRNERKELRRDIRATKANPTRYSNPRKDYGERTAVEGQIAKSDKAAAQAYKRKAMEREKIANTPRAKSKVDETLQAKRNAEIRAAKIRAAKANKAGGVKRIKRGS